VPPFGQNGRGVTLCPPLLTTQITGTKQVTYHSYFPTHLNNTPDPDKVVAAAVERAVAAMCHPLSNATAGAIHDIVRANFTNGRVQVFLQGHDSVNVQDYVYLVVKTHRQLSTYLYDLQVRRFEKDLLPLFEQLQLWAYNLLLQKDHAPGMASLAGAEKCARNALRAILSTPFPYDTEFEPWAIIRLRHVCREAGAGSNYRLGPLPLVEYDV
jgi:hypothetical protein